MKKVDYPIDKRKWSLSLIPGAVVLASTYNAKKEPNIAPISWVQMASFTPPIIMFSTTKNSTTAKNILQANCFGVNFVDSSIVSRVNECIKWHGQERIQKTGFKIVEASKINAPLVDDCKAHLECRLYDTKEVGDSFVVFGEITGASIWNELLSSDTRYEKFNQVLYLEENLFAKIDKAFNVGGDKMKDSFIRYVILLNEAPGTNITRELVKAHVEHLKELENSGRLVICGPFADYKGGMLVISADSFDEAKKIAENDPFVKDGARTYELRTLEVSCKENNHMGMG